LSNLSENIKKSPEIPNNYWYYWNYMYQLGRTSVVPYLQQYNAFKKGFKVAEIGSAEGGVLMACVESGAVEALGTDIAVDRLLMGEKIAKVGGLDIQYDEHNIITEEPKNQWRENFDLVLLRDVIEHLDYTEIALKNIRKIIKKDGFLFVTFPPYHSPFGGHQHTVASLGGKFPYIHLLPDFIFHKLIEKGRQNDIGEVKRLQNIRLTPAKFEKAALAAGFSIYKNDFYFLRPVFKMKFGLPAIKSTALSWIPGVKQFASLEACYILQNK